MFGFASRKKKLEAKYKKLLAESHKLSRINRMQSDQKLGEAEEVRKQLELLETESG